jgi:hypothetical protein
VEPLGGCTGLRAVDLAENRLNGLSLAGHLGGLTALTHLNLQGNGITRVDEVVSLVRALPGLRVLNLQDGGGERACPVCGQSSYQSSVVEAAPRLVFLDGEALVLREAAKRVLEAAEGYKAGMDVSLGGEYSRPWVEPAGEAIAGTSTEALVSESVVTEKAVRDTRKAIAALVAEDRRQGRSLPPPG